MGADGGERRLPDAGHVEEGLGGGERPVGLTVGDDPRRDRGPETWQLGQLIGISRVNVDRK